MKINKIFFLFASLFISSCSCDYHLSKVREKCKSLLTTDTIRVKDTIRIIAVTHDTLFKHSRDTVHAHHDRLTMKYFYNTKDSTIYLYGKCDSIIKYVDKQIIVNKDVYKTYNWHGIIS